MEQQYTLSVLVENHAGVLSKVVGLFSRRGFNIDSLSVGPTHDPSVSRITIEVTGNESMVEQISNQVFKLIDVIKIKILRQDEVVKRNLILVKVKCNSRTRNEIIEIANVFRANIIDISATTVTAEVTGSVQKVNAFIEMMEPFGLEEIAQTGVTALERGTSTLKLDK